MKRLIIADSHVGTLPGDADAMVALLRRACAAGFGEVIYLGDTCQYLIGMSKFWTDSVRLVLSAWDEVRAEGVKVRLIEGNRDFFLDEVDLASRIDSVHISLEFTAGDLKYRLVHGDKVNHRDLQYLFWSRLSKSWPARLWARLLPRGIAVRIVRTMEARLAETNRKYRYTKPIEALKKDAAAGFACGFDVVLWGHFHTYWDTRDGDRMAMIVPAWMESQTVLVVGEDGSWTLADSNLVEIDPPEPSP